MKIYEKYPRIISFCLGLLWGVALTFTCGIFYLRASLIREIPGRLSYEETVRQFPVNASAIPGWTIRSQKCGLPAGKISASSSVPVPMPRRFLPPICSWEHHPVQNRNL
ncbi:MAG: hypothetical protein V8T87_14025 [Victivallales bacterium]